MAAYDNDLSAEELPDWRHAVAPRRFVRSENVGPPETCPAMTLSLGPHATKKNTPIATLLEDPNLATPKLVRELERIGWFVTRGPSPGVLVYHRPDGPSRRYAHRKLGRIGGWPNFFESLGLVRRFLVDTCIEGGMLPNGWAAEHYVPFNLRCQAPGGGTRLEATVAHYFRWTTLKTPRTDADDRALVLDRVFLSLEETLAALRPKRWIPLQRITNNAVGLCELWRQSESQQIHYKALVEMVGAVSTLLSPGPAHLALRALPPRRRAQHVARTLRFVAAVAPAVLKNHVKWGLERRTVAELEAAVVFAAVALCPPGAPPRGTPLRAPPDDGLVSGPFLEGRLFLLLARAWRDVAAVAIKLAPPPKQADLVGRALALATAIGFDDDDRAEVSSQLMITSGAGIRTQTRAATVAYFAHGGPALQDAAGRIENRSANAAAKILQRCVEHGPSRAVDPTADDEYRGLAHTAAGPACADCAVVECHEYVDAKNDTFSLCTACYKYRHLENPTARFRRKATDGAGAIPRDVDAAETEGRCAQA